MKKIYVLTLLALGAAFGASAQTVVNNPSNTAYFGIRASGDITAPGKVKYDDVKTKNFNNGGGFSVGAVYNIPVVANLYVEPGLNFYYNSTGIKTLPALDKGFDHHSLRETGFRVPVMLGYHFDFTDDVNLAVFTGPELQVGLSSDYYVKTDGHGMAPSTYGDNSPFPMHRVGLNWDFGVGFNVAQNYYIGVSGSVGLTNMSRIDNASFIQNRVAFTLGYNFK